MRGRLSNRAEVPVTVELSKWVEDNHPLRRVKAVVDRALEAMDDELESMYDALGRPSVPPECLLRAMVLQVLHGIRSERQLAQMIHDSLSFRWFVGIGLKDRMWDHSTFSRNRERLVSKGIAGKFLKAVTAQAAAKHLLSKDHFSVDGTLLEACASIKSFKPKDTPPEDGGGASGGGMRDFRGERLSNTTHQSTTDKEARLYRKGEGQSAKMSYMGHVATENRSGFVVAAYASTANGTAERNAALAMLDSLPPRGRRRTVWCDKGYDERRFVQGCRERRFTPHAAAKRSGGAVDGRTTRHATYAKSQRRRKKVEEPFGWMKQWGLMRKLRHVGLALVDWQFQWAAATYNVVLLLGMRRRPFA